MESKGKSKRRQKKMKRQKGRREGAGVTEEGMQNRAGDCCVVAAEPQAHTPCPEPEQEPERQPLLRRGTP